MAVFREEGISGGNSQRKAMSEMLKFLEEQTEEIAVIIDDLKRFSRDVSIHFDLKLAICQRGGRLMSPSFRFGDEPEDRFIETIMAASAELERNQNKKQVHNRMKARLENGYWCFKAPNGYHFEKHPVHKKILVADKDLKKIHTIRTALEGFASNRFLSQSDVAAYLNSVGYIGANGKPYVNNYKDHVREILTNPLYCGYLEYEAWGITLKKAQHKPIISLGTYQANQAKLNNRRPDQLMRRDTSSDFALRGFVSCSECGTLLTASWSKGRHDKYPYYHCKNRQCIRFGKSIPRKHLHTYLTDILEGLKVSDEVMEIARDMGEDTWRRRMQEQSTSLVISRSRLDEINDEVKSLGSKLAKTSSPVSFRVIEQHLIELETEREKIIKIIERTKHIDTEFGTAFDSIKNWLQNPCSIWQEHDLQTKRLVIRIVFTRPITYDRETGLGTADFELPYLIIQHISAGKYSLVEVDQKTWNLFVDVIFELYVLVGKRL